MSSLDNYLKPAKFCESDSKKIIELANSITKNRNSEKEKVSAIFNWVRDKICYDVIKIIGAEKVLERNPMKGVCVDKANTFIALCRASGIPARYVSTKSILKLKNKFKPIPHMMTEVYFNGKWHLEDPTFGNYTKKIIKSSEFNKIKNLEIIGKPKIYKNLPPIIVAIVNFIYKINPTTKKLKQIFNK